MPSSRITKRKTKRKRKKCRKVTNTKTPKKLKKPEFTCDLCKFSTNERNAMLKHITSYHVDKPYSCELCSFRTCSHVALKLHMETHGLFYECKYCNYIATEPLAMEHHNGTHVTPKPYECDLCDYKTTDQNLLIKHEESHGDPQKVKHGCNLCESGKDMNILYTKTGWRLCKYHRGELDNMMITSLCTMLYIKSSPDQWSYNRITMHFATPPPLNLSIEPNHCNSCNRTFKAKVGFLSHIRAHLRKK